MDIFIGRLLELLSDLFLQAFVNQWQQVAVCSKHQSETSSRPVKRQRSIVRIIGTYLPLCNAPRVHLNLAAWNNCANNYAPNVTFHEQDFGKDGLDSNGTIRCHNAEREANNKYLQEQLDQLKLFVAEILEKQSDTIKEIVEEILDKQKNKTVGRMVLIQTDSEEENKPSVELSIPPPPPPLPPTPPPPPPPPPLPPAAVYIGINGLKGTRKYQSSNSSPNSSNSSTPQTTAKEILGQLMLEMKNGRPKLRPVQRSPGGNPIKRARTPSKADPADILTEVLRRRYSSLAQMSDTNGSDTSSGVASSPDWRSCSA